MAPEEAEAYLVVVGHVLARLTQDAAEAKWGDKGADAALKRIERELASSPTTSAGTCRYASSPRPRCLQRARAPALVGSPPRCAGLMPTRRAHRPRQGAGRGDHQACAQVAWGALCRRGHPCPIQEAPSATGPRPEDVARARCRWRSHGTAPLGGLTEIRHNLAELRNPYGSGHGRAERIAGIALLADLAARAADAYATFILGVFEERAAG